MKKIVTLLAMLGLSLSVTANAFAAESDLSLTLERTTKDEVSVEVNTNGDVNGAVLEIAYDATAVSVTEEDIEVNAEYDAINIVNGAVKISFLSEENIPEGTVVTINFDIAESAQSKYVTELGIKATATSAVDEAGNTQESAAVEVVELTDTVVPAPETGDGEGGTGTGNGSGSDLDTGDNTVVLPYVILAAAAVGGASVLYFKKK